MTTANLDVEKCREMLVASYNLAAVDQLRAALALLAEAREALVFLEGKARNWFQVSTEYGFQYDTLVARIPDLSALELGP